MFCCFKKTNKISPIQCIYEQIDQNTMEQLKNAKKIIFCDEYNFPVINVPNNIQSINFNSRYFNHALDNLPIGLKELNINQRFNQPLDYLPQGLEKLQFKSGSIFNHTMENLPNSLKLLEIPLLYNQSIDNLPNNIEELRIGVKNIINDDNMFCPESDNIGELDIQHFNQKIRKLPNNIKKILIFPEYEHLQELKQKYGNIVKVVDKTMYVY